MFGGCDAWRFGKLGGVGCLEGVGVFGWGLGCLGGAVFGGLGGLSSWGVGVWRELGVECLDRVGVWDVGWEWCLEVWEIRGSSRGFGCLVGGVLGGGVFGGWDVWGVQCLGVKGSSSWVFGGLGVQGSWGGVFGGLRVGLV